MLDAFFVRHQHEKFIGKELIHVFKLFPKNWTALIEAMKTVSVENRPFASCGVHIVAECDCVIV